MVPPGFHEVLRGLRGGVSTKKSTACCWGCHLIFFFIFFLFFFGGGVADRTSRNLTRSHVKPSEDCVQSPGTTRGDKHDGGNQGSLQVLFNA